MSEEDKPYSRLFNPERVCLSSKDDQTTLRADDVPGYYDTFRIQLPIPVLNIKSIEFLRGSIPCIYASLPDSELVFWYYRIPSIPDISPVQPYAPSLQYLHCVRIQPSFIPKELLATIIYGGSQTYADVIPINRVYSGYTDLLTDLSLACKYDIPANSYFIADDIKFEFDETLNKYSFTGLNPIYSIPNYLFSSTYQQNDIVLYNGTKYISQSPNNTNNPAFSIQDWFSGTQFYKGNVCYYGNVYYTAILNSLNVVPTNTIYWLPTIYNSRFDYVNKKGFNTAFNGQWYVSITDASNFAQNPTSSPTFWKLQTTPLMYNEWLNYPFVYQFGAIIVYSGIYYTAKYENSGEIPETTPLYWFPSLYDPAKDYVRASGTFGIGFRIIYNNVVYESLTNNTNIGNRPDISPNYWTPAPLTFVWTITTDTITNFYSYAGYSDPNVLIASQNLQSLTTNAYGIQGLPGQPFFKNRDLNLRLGFVYSGELLSQNAYRNHLRPVPLYLLGVGATFAFPTYTYIAESYGDLVNTSAVYVYCNVIGGSGYDSLGRPDLLTIVPLNTATLGVAFYNNVISTPMIKVPREIYEIQFTLRTDTGDRYYLPDSAITNFEIKFNFL